MTDERDEPFQPILDELGLDDANESLEQALVYREAPDRRCFVCERSIPESGRELAEGEEYVVLRTNPEDEPFPMVERTFHVDCWEEYRS